VALWVSNQIQIHFLEYGVVMISNSILWLWIMIVNLLCEVPTGGVVILFPDYGGDFSLWTDCEL
jgi:hypothetical protein